MRNSIRVTQFVIAFMVTVVLYALVLPQFDIFYMTDYHFLATGLGLVLLVFPAVLAISRYAFSFKNYDPGKFFFATVLHKKGIWRHRIIFWALLGVILLTPVVRGIVALNTEALVIIAGMYIVLIEFLLRLTYLSTQAHFMSDAIIIRGIDLRPDFPVGEPIRNNCGTYSYRSIAAFVVEGNHFHFVLKDQEGVLDVLIPQDKVQNIVAFLSSKEIPRKHAHEVERM